MNRTFAAVGGRVLCAVASAALLAACDDDPGGVRVTPLTGDISSAVTPDTIGTQGSLRVVFNRALNPATALDQANFVVINTCTGLRVPGSLRLGRDAAGNRDTLIFSPTQALPFLTPLAVRVQNLLDVGGAALSQPITFSRITERPPVSDLSWSFLNSPTSDDITGISFVNDNLGFALANGGTVFRTDNRGVSFAAIFKNIDVTDTYSLRALTADSLYMLGTIQIGSTSFSGVFKSRNGGLTFDTARTLPNSRFTAFALRRSPAGHVIGLAGGISSTPLVSRYDAFGNTGSPGATETFTPATGIPPLFTPNSLIRIPLGVDLSPSTANAAVALALFDFNGNGRGAEALRSVDGGRSFINVPLPANTPTLQGANFISETDVLLVGDSSAVLRMNATTGAVTALGQAAGIPQSFVDTLTGTVSTFSFFRTEFVQGTQTGWIVGRVTLQPRGGPAAIRGVILFTNDGGATWRRQGIQGAPNNGLDFPPVLEIQARSSTFAVLSGSNGLVAINTGNANSVAACSFNPR